MKRPNIAEYIRKLIDRKPVKLNDEQMQIHGASIKSALRKKSETINAEPVIPLKKKRFNIASYFYRKSGAEDQVEKASESVEKLATVAETLLELFVEFGKGFGSGLVSSYIGEKRGLGENENTGKQIESDIS